MLIGALERLDGLLIDRLLNAGLRVTTVHPNRATAMRPRFSRAGGKGDSFDAFVLAELARTDARCLRVMIIYGDQTKPLRALTRSREDMLTTRVTLVNEVKARLNCFWPGATTRFGDIDSPIALAFYHAEVSAGRWVVLALVATLRPIVT